MGSDPGNDWPRLARFVLERRNELGLKQEEVRQAGGPSTATLRNIEGASQASYKPHILAGLERALQWKTGSVQAILSGGEPLTAEAAAREGLARERAGQPTVADIVQQHDEILAKVKEFLADADAREERVLLGMLQALRQSRSD
ncbi:hypothetical protein [Actinomadura hibisca]|uniref:hypothetical protein n=1 Tax=Actinomadura hibisca TaxID=68565 RepID=UPI0008307459|nr:hypothetical protein [Actinomadura hibisca]